MKGPYQKFLCLMFCWLIAGCAEKDDQQVTPTLPDAYQYFKELALNAEFEDSKTEKIRKWTKDIRYYVKGTPDKTLFEELDRIVGEINTLIGAPQLIQTDKPDEANFQIFFGSGSDYADKVEPNAADYVEENFGLFWVYWNNSYEITHGSMYVDIYRTQKLNEKKHLLREELTQSLGLMNDSDQYPESIFYQGWTSTTEYTPIDKEVIKLLYHEKMKTGMNLQQVDEVLRELSQ